MMLCLTGCGVVFCVLWQTTCRLGLRQPSPLCARITRRTRTPSWRKEPLSESNTSACPPHISLKKIAPGLFFLISLCEVPPKDTVAQSSDCWQMLYTLDFFFYGCYPLFCCIHWIPSFMAVIHFYVVYTGFLLSGLLSTFFFVYTEFLLLRLLSTFGCSHMTAWCMISWYGGWQTMMSLLSVYYPLLIAVIWLHDLWSVATGDDRPWCHCWVSDREIYVSCLILIWHKPPTDNENCMSYNK